MRHREGLGTLTQDRDDARLFISTTQGFVVCMNKEL